MFKPLAETNAVYAQLTQNGELPLNPPNAWWDEHDPRLAESGAAAEAITAAWKRGEITTTELAHEHLRLIEIEVARGVIPWDVLSFSELHDYVDANEFTLETQGFDMSDDGNAAANAVQDRVDALLRGTVRLADFEYEHGEPDDTYYDEDQGEVISTVTGEPVEEEE